MKRELEGKLMKKSGILSIIILLISMLLVQPIFCTSIEAENTEYYNNLNSNSSYNGVLDYYNKDNGKGNKEYEDNEIVEYLNYTDEYIEYLKLSDEEKSKVYIIPRKYYVPLDMIYEDTIEVKEKPSVFNLFGLFADTTLQKTYGSSLPDKFDLRDKINIKVENQRSYGNCWNFSAMTSLETNLALKGYGDYDFSELHMDYLTSKEVDPSMIRTLNVSGGNFQFFTDYVSTLKGPVLETEVPYNKRYDKSQYSYLQSLEPKAYILESVAFPIICKIDGKPFSRASWLNSYDNYNVSDKEMELYRDTVKNHIMNNGSLWTYLSWGSCKEKENYTTYYTTGNYSYGDPHIVSIIGWDDNFPKEYFEEVTSDGTFKPSKDGAYIALNSYGTNWGNNGVFYISYEDSEVESELYGIVRATNKSEDVVKKTVNFEDENLYNFLKQQLNHKIYSYDDATKSIVFTEYAISTVNELDMTNSNVSNLSGLENFWNLRYLNLNFCEIGGSNSAKNNSVLSSLTNLEVLDLGGSNISDIECLKKLINLEYLILSNNNIDDFTPLNNLSNLKVLNLSKTNISNLECIKDLVQLRVLQIDNNNISNFDGLSNLTNLQKLYIQNTNMVDVECLKKLTKLEELILGDSTLKDFDRLSELVNLKKLILTHNCDLENIDFLKNLTNLEKLQIEYTNINDYSALDDLSNLSICHTNMTVYHDISTGNKLPLPNMFSYVYNNISDKTKIKAENCTIDYANKEIIIDTLKGNTGVATVTLEGVHTISNNSFGDSVYTINFAEGPLINITTTYNTIELSNKEIITDLNSLNNLSSEVLTYEHFPNNGCDMKAYDSDGNEISSTDKFPTGSRIEITAPNGMSKTYYVFVKGDVDQNGTVDLYDILKLIELVFDNDLTYVWDEFVRLAGKCAYGPITENPNLYDIMRLIEFQFDNKGW